jgi:hypothetical protein
MTYDELKTLITETFLNSPAGYLESCRDVADKVWPLTIDALAKKGGKVFVNVETVAAPAIPDDHSLISHHDCGTAEEIITGLAELGLRPLVEAYLTGRGYDDARASVESLYKAVAP